MKTFSLYLGVVVFFGGLIALAIAFPVLWILLIIWALLAYGTSR